MRGSKLTREVLVVLATMTLLTCSCAVNKPASSPGQSEKNHQKYELFFTQLSDTAIVGGDLLIVGEARVPAEVSGGVTQRNMSADVKVPFEEKCFSLIRGGLPQGKELRIVGRGWSEPKPIQEGNHAISFTFVELLNCEVRSGQ